MNADNAYGKGGDFALLLSAVIKRKATLEQVYQVVHRPATD